MFSSNYSGFLCFLQIWNKWHSLPWKSSHRLVGPWSICQCQLPSEQRRHVLIPSQRPKEEETWRPAAICNIATTSPNRWFLSSPEWNIQKKTLNQTSRDRSFHYHSHKSEGSSKAFWVPIREILAVSATVQSLLGHTKGCSIFDGDGAGTPGNRLRCAATEVGCRKDPVLGLRWGGTSQQNWEVCPEAGNCIATLSALCTDINVHPQQPLICEILPPCIQFNVSNT